MFMQPFTNHILAWSVVSVRIPYSQLPFGNPQCVIIHCSIRLINLCALLHLTVFVDNIKQIGSHRKNLVSFSRFYM